MRDRELAMPICPGMVPPGWIEAQGLIAFPEQPPLTDVAQEREAAKTSLCASPNEGKQKTMHRAHRFALQGMQVPLRMKPARCNWWQTGAELRRAMATNQRQAVLRTTTESVWDPTRHCEPHWGQAPTQTPALLP